MMARKRVHSDSGSDDDEFEAVVSSQGRAATRRAPKRQASAQAVRAATQNELKLDSEEEFEGDDADPEEVSGDEQAPMPTKRSGQSAKTNSRRRIDSDDDSDAEPSASPPVNVESPVKPTKIKLRLSTSTSTKPRKLLKEERSSSRPATQEGSSSKKSSVPKRPSLASSSQPAVQPLIKKPSARPTEATLSSSRDLDLTNPATMMSLFKSTGTPVSTKELQPGVHEALRAAATKAREAETRNTFDLMAASEKIRAFEACMEGMGVWPLPQVLLHPLSGATVPPPGPTNGSQQTSQ